MHAGALPLGRRPSAEELLRELGGNSRLVVYLASAPGAGKTRRLLEEARRMRKAGLNVMIGTIELKDRPGLAALVENIPHVPPRHVAIGGATFSEFDVDAAIRLHPDIVILDELAHENLTGSAHAKRWQDALALREAGISVYGAFNISHVETVAASAEAITGYPVREIIPFSFLKSADEVIALDVSPQLLQLRLRSGKIVKSDDIDRALGGIFKDQTLQMLRQLLLRTIDDLTSPAVRAEQVSTAAAILVPDVSVEAFLRRTYAVSSALDLALEIRTPANTDLASLVPIARELDAEILPETPNLSTIDISKIRASLIAVPQGSLAKTLANRRLDRDLFIVGKNQTFINDAPFISHPYDQTSGDRMRVGYGKLTVYLGAAAGSGKTYAMLDRAQQLKSDGIDIVAGLIETHGRPETEAMLQGLPILPRKHIDIDGVHYQEFDREAVLHRNPKVVLIDELAHSNAPGSLVKKRYEDVLAILRAGIDVITTLNVQHLEALSDAVFRLTGTIVRETLPDGILALADEVILIDVTPETLRERLRAGKIYPADRIESALANFFTTNNLLALRELALREALRARNRHRLPAPFRRLLLSVSARPQDIALIKRCSRIAARLEVEYAVVFISPDESKNLTSVQAIRDAAQRENATWIQEVDRNVPQAILRIARSQPETTLAVSGTLRTPTFMQRPSFARRLLDAGARELLVLATRAPIESQV